MEFIPPAFRQRRFTTFWIVLTLSWAANQIQAWALLWHIRTLTDLPLALGVVGLIRLLPTLALSLIAGRIADAVNRRRIMIVTQALFAAIAFFLVVLTRDDRATLWVIYGAIGLQAIFLTFDLPARQSLIPNLVLAHDLHNAFSLQIAGFQIGALIGPAISGLAIERAGLASPYLISTLIYAAMIGLLLVIGPVAQQSDPGRDPTSNDGAIRQGVRFTLRHPLILPSMLLDFFVTALTRADNLMPIFARDILFVGPVAYGWLSAAQSLGASLAGLVFTQIRELRRQGPMLFGVAILVGLGTIIFGASARFALSMTALSMVGAADAVSAIIRNTIRQIETPDQLRGRMVSVNQIFFVGGPQLGELRAAAIGQWLGVPLAVSSGGFACLAAAVFIALRWPELRRYDGVRRPNRLNESGESLL